MNKEILLQLEHQLLNEPLRFDLTAFFRGNISTQNVLTNFNSCGTSACIIGHLMVIQQVQKFPPNVAEFAFEVLDIKEEEKSSFYDATYNLWRYWGSELAALLSPNKITNLMAADLICHMRIHNTVPDNYASVEKYYTRYTTNQSTTGIKLWYCKGDFSPYIGVGTDKQQAIADYSEQLAKRLKLAKGLK